MPQAVREAPCALRAVAHETAEKQLALTRYSTFSVGKGGSALCDVLICLTNR